MNTTEKGNLAELKIAVKLLEQGRMVLKSVGDGCRYDLLVDDNGAYTRIQCKTGRLRNGVIRFNAFSQCSWKTELRKYNGQADVFGVYCAENDTCYLIPVTKVSAWRGWLRLTPVRNGQKHKVMLASDFELRSSGAIISALPSEGKG